MRVIIDLIRQVSLYHTNVIHVLAFTSLAWFGDFSSDMGHIYGYGLPW
jgi:hypothetical protein